MMGSNLLRTKLDRGDCVLGSWAVVPSVETADIICSAGLDFLIIDSEHGPIGFETAQKMAIACEARGVTPIMRVGGVIESDILRCLDIGMHGVQVPNVTSSADVAKIIEYAKFPPVGNRGFSPFTRAGNYDLASATTLTDEANANIMIAINVEGKEALDNLDQIFSYDDLDIVFVGLFDISKSLGIPGQVKDKRVLEMLQEIAIKGKKYGKYVGTIATELEQIEIFANLGLQYIVYLVDVDVLRSGYASAVGKLNAFKAQK